MGAAFTPERKQSDPMLYKEYKKLSSKTLVDKNKDRVTATCTPRTNAPWTWVWKQRSQSLLTGACVWRAGRRTTYSQALEKFRDKPMTHIMAGNGVTASVKDLNNLRKYFDDLDDDGSGTSESLVESSGVTPQPAVTICWAVPDEMKSFSLADTVEPEEITSKMMEATKAKKLRAEGKMSDREWEEAKERFASFGMKLSSKADEIGGTMDCTQVIACVALDPLNCSISTLVCGGPFGGDSLTRPKSALQLLKYMDGEPHLTWRNFLKMMYSKATSEGLDRMAEVHEKKEVRNTDMSLVVLSVKIAALVPPR